MGTDISFFTEVKIDGQWHLHSVQHIDRNYDLFGDLSGIRNGGKPAKMPVRGLPSDPSIVLQKYIERYQYDMHHQTYIKSDEMDKFYRVITPHSQYEMPETLIGYLLGNGWEGHSFWRGCGIEDVRFVYWYDC